MRRTVSETKIGEERVRYRTRIEDDDVPDAQKFMRQRLFLQHLADQPDLLNCGYSRFQTLHIRWDSGRWVAEAEAEVLVEASNG